MTADESHDGAARATSADRATLLITAGSSTVAFTLGFNFGAFGVIFFDAVFTVWVIATIVFFASVITDLPPHTWTRRVVLLVPSLWLAMSWIDTNLDLENSNRALLLVSLAVTLIALPFVGWFLITAINTDFVELPRRHKQTAIAATVVFLLVGLLLGARNDTILTCDDFKVSGNDLPDNCVVDTSS